MKLERVCSISHVRMLLSPLNDPAIESTSSGRPVDGRNLPTLSLDRDGPFLAGNGRVVCVTFGNISHWVLLYNTHWVINLKTPTFARLGGYSRGSIFNWLAWDPIQTCTQFRPDCLA